MFTFRDQPELAFVHFTANVSPMYLVRIKTYQFTLEIIYFQTS